MLSFVFRLRRNKNTGCHLWTIYLFIILYIVHFTASTYRPVSPRVRARKSKNSGSQRCGARQGGIPVNSEFQEGVPRLLLNKTKTTETEFVAHLTGRLAVACLWSRYSEYWKPFRVVGTLSFSYRNRIKTRFILVNFFVMWVHLMHLIQVMTMLSLLVQK
jgi:hypothetical protein